MKPSTSYEFAAIVCLVLIVGSLVEIGPLAAWDDRTGLWVVASVSAATATILREMGR